MSFEASSGEGYRELCAFPSNPCSFPMWLFFGGIVSSIFSGSMTAFDGMFEVCSDECEDAYLSFEKWESVDV